MQTIYKLILVESKFIIVTNNPGAGPLPSTPSATSEFLSMTTKVPNRLPFSKEVSIGGAKHSDISRAYFQLRSSFGLPIECGKFRRIMAVVLLIRLLFLFRTLARPFVILRLAIALSRDISSPC